MMSRFAYNKMISQLPSDYRDLEYEFLAFKKLQKLKRKDDRKKAKLIKILGNINPVIFFRHYHTSIIGTKVVDKDTLVTNAVPSDFV